MAWGTRYTLGMVKRIVRLRGLAVAMSAAGLLAGCGDDTPTKPIVPATPTYAIPSTPQNVLANLQLAYERRDSVEYKLLYDPSYEGKSTNTNDPDPASQISSFGWADEVAHLANMARATNITDVTMDLGPSTSWQREPSDLVAHPDWSMIQLANYYSITIYSALTDYSVSWQPGDQMKFYFLPTTPASTSPTDTLWNIVYWEELGASFP